MDNNDERVLYNRIRMLISTLRKKKGNFDTAYYLVGLTMNNFTNEQIEDVNVQLELLIKKLMLYSKFSLDQFTDQPNILQKVHFYYDQICDYNQKLMNIIFPGENKFIDITEQELQDLKFKYGMIPLNETDAIGEFWGTFWFI